MTQQKTQQITPMMKQFLAIKKAHADYMLFYRMGDFYELFFDDAIKASNILNIVLTKRGKNNGEDIPMCGVPIHSHESYLERLIKSGEKVAICEQMESPEDAKKRGGYKAVVKREVVRIITAGTITEETLLQNTTNNFLASIAEYGKHLAIALIDISTGEFYVSNTTQENLPSDLSRFSISEIIFPQVIFENNEIYPYIKQNYQSFSHHPLHMFNKSKGEEQLKKIFNIAVLDSLGDLSNAELGACGALLEYINLTQKGKYPRLDIPRKIQNSYYMAIDASTRRNLELHKSIKGEYKNSLLSIIDYTITSNGSRLFSSYLSSPLTDFTIINKRLDVVEFFVEEETVQENTRKQLKEMPDIERAISRISLGRGTPNDLFAIRVGLEVATKIKQILQSYNGISSPDGLTAYVVQLGEHSEIIHTLSKAINDEPTAKDFIAEGYSLELDEQRVLEKEGGYLIKKLQSVYAEETGVSALKIKHNNMLGYFVEVNKNNADKLPDTFVHRQTISNAMRFKTEKLAGLEQRISEASNKIAELELRILKDLISMVAEKAEDIVTTARTIANIDVSASLARLAMMNNFVRPIVDNSLKFEIEDGRHPVVEENTDNFISNSCNLKNNFWLLTGPNMAGKSTFLRQNAVIAIMAQIGSFVPAKSAHIGVVDKLFSRVGASDDLASGRSTFMVEMVETATILNQATEKSFVILDEIGRGTATFDGLSIAWAAIEQLHDINKCRTLFATHYHELTELVDKLDNLHCVTMQVKEWKDEIIFLHKIVNGAADRSYGIHVAQLAGIPKPVIIRANEILNILENTERQKIPESMPLFNNAMSNKEMSNNKPSLEVLPEPSIIEQKLNEINVDELTPKQALDLIYELKNN